MQKLEVQLLEDLSSRKHLPATAKTKAKIAGHRKKSLPPALEHILREVQRELGLEWTDQELSPTSAYLEELISRVADRLGFDLARFERDEILAQIEKEQREFGILQDLIDDQGTTDIIVTHYARIAVQQGRRNLTTDLSFSNQESYEAYVERLLQKAGTTYSTKKPIADGMIGSFARIHAVHRCLCESGPYLTIRLNRFPSITVDDLVKFELAPREILDYLTVLVRAGSTVLVAGEVGTGKTTLVRAIASSMPEHESILVIEDTPEIRLEHPHVRYITTRESNTDGAGLITSAECIRAGMRMAMNRIIFGEMRDADAAESFIDVCASGHPGLSTIHARNSAEAISRLELFLGRAQRGVSRHVIYEQISKAVQVIVFVDLCPITGKRRIMEIKELGAVADNVIRQRDIFNYQFRGNEIGWKLCSRASGYKEILEADGVNLAKFPPMFPVAR